MDILTQLARRIKELRKIYKLSQEKLAEMADVHPTYIGKIERAEINSSILFLAKIAKAFNMSLSELLAFPDVGKIERAKPKDIDRLIEFLKDSLEISKEYKKEG
ncbi:MAG TPA: XRE family transcriptional regulator [bacterium (Candidatus Stahlbacteria)]|nr:XRE family transcriptional regulator [Candidatus Stahlbacteria bacterium]